MADAFMGGYWHAGAAEYHTDVTCPRGSQIPPAERREGSVVGTGMVKCATCDARQREALVERRRFGQEGR